MGRGTWIGGVVRGREVVLSGCVVVGGSAERLTSREVVDSVLFTVLLGLELGAVNASVRRASGASSSSAVGSVVRGAAVVGAVCGR